MGVRIMAQPPLSEEVLREALDAVARHGTVTAAAMALGVSRPTLHHRYTEALRRLGSSSPTAPACEGYPARRHATVIDGRIVVFSDAHFRPGELSTAFRALVWLLPDLRPSILVCNGDALDGASISRHPRIGWEDRPTLKEELAEVTARMDEARRGAPGAELVWTMGNHDARFDTFLSANAPQIEGVDGARLSDRFPEWRFCWRLDVNPGSDGHTVIKHRGKGGIHAAHNNTKDYGCHFVTGHLHKLDVRRWTDIRGTRYGVDTGTLSDTTGPAFSEYTEDAVTGWRSGFVVLTYRGGRLLAPELVEVVGPGRVEFRGDEWSV